MRLIRGDQQPQYQQPMPGQIPPQQQQPQTLMQRALKREKWILVYSVVVLVIQLVEIVFSNTTFSYAMTNFAFNFVGLSLLNFTLVPWVQNTFFRSKQATEDFFNQKL